jgi:phenolic acid decarboxylase
MERFRSEGPTYPIYVVPEFATITFIESCGLNDESVIACAPGYLPAGYANRRNCGRDARRPGGTAG